jgi:Ca-activated chloride channel homolog
LLLGLLPFSGHAEELSPLRMEGLLVVDVSKSMLESDPNKISNEAMKMFVDMLSLQGDKLGVIAFAQGVMREKGLVKIQSYQEKNDLKEFIDSLEKYPFTDMSTGVKEAVKVLDSNHQQGYSPLIVLLADGNNDLGKNSNKTTKQADEDLSKYVADAQAKGYPIYTIGLNADGKLNKDILKNIAETTNGKFFETKSADSLPDILSEIFANHSKLKIVSLDNIVANGDYQDIEVNVPNENVIEANISLMSSKPVEVRLVNPEGSELPLTSENLHISTSTTYTMIKLIKPEQGDWILKVKGVPQDKIDINLIFNYDLQLKLAPLSTEKYNPNNKVKVEAFFEDGGETVSNEQLYQSMKATLFVKDLDSGTTEEMALSPGTSSFTGELKLGDASEYEVFVKADDNSFYRETQPEKILMNKIVVNDPPKPDEVEPPFPWLKVILGVIGSVILIAILFFGIKKFLNWKKQGLTGHMRIEIKDDASGDRTEPDHRPLKAFGRKLQLNDLLYISDESDFVETSQITFKALAGDKIAIINHSECTIEKNGRKLDRKKNHEMRRNDRLRIVFEKEKKSILLEYTS